MADIKWIKITTDIFDDEKILLIESLPEADAIIVIWFKLLCMAKLKNRYGELEYKISIKSHIELTDKVLNVLLKRKNAARLINTLEEYGFIKRNQYSITIIPFWCNREGRTSARYSHWRKSVLRRDDYTCQGCGTKKDLQAHHIVRWSDCTGDKQELRYAVENGITLCRACHLEAHGGDWRG